MTSRAETAALVARMARRRTGQHRRRLLRHHAGAYRGDCRSCRGLGPRQIPPADAAPLPGSSPSSWPHNDLRMTPAGARFVNIGERTNVTGSAKFKKLILAGDYDAAVEVARDQVENGAQMIDVNMDEGLLDAEQAMTTFLKRIAAEPDIARVPVMIDSSKWSVIEAGLKCVSGKPIVNSISMKEGEEPFLDHAAQVHGLWRGGGGHGLRRNRPGRHQKSARSRSASAPTSCSSGIGFPPEDIIFDPNIFAVATGIEEHTDTRSTSSRRRGDPRALPARPYLGRAIESQLLLPRQRAGAPGDALCVPLSRHSRRAGHGDRQRRPARHL